MANIKSAYGTGGDDYILHPASLANSSARASTAIDNSTNLWLDAPRVCQRQDRDEWRPVRSGRYSYTHTALPMVERPATPRARAEQTAPLTMANPDKPEAARYQCVGERDDLPKWAFPWRLRSVACCRITGVS